MQQKKKTPRGMKQIGVRTVCRMLEMSRARVMELVDDKKLSKPKKKGRGSALRWYLKDIWVYRWRELRGDFDDLDEPAVAKRSKP
jgi:predicted DNA-binding transcriptional regulator AlpA